MRTLSRISGGDFIIQGLQILTAVEQGGESVEDPSKVRGERTEGAFFDVPREHTDFLGKILKSKNPIPYKRMQSPRASYIPGTALEEWTKLMLEGLQHNNFPISPCSKPFEQLPISLQLLIRSTIQIMFLFRLDRAPENLASAV
jgi:hypothetical protein